MLLVHFKLWNCTFSAGGRATAGQRHGFWAQLVTQSTLQCFSQHFRFICAPGLLLPMPPVRLSRLQKHDQLLINLEILACDLWLAYWAIDKLIFVHTAETSGKTTAENLQKPKKMSRCYLFVPTNPTCTAASAGSLQNSQTTLKIFSFELMFRSPSEQLATSDLVPCLLLKIIHTSPQTLSKQKVTDFISHFSSAAPHFCFL